MKQYAFYKKVFDKVVKLTESFLGTTEPFDDAPFISNIILSPVTKEPVYVKKVRNRFFFFQTCNDFLKLLFPLF